MAGAQTNWAGVADRHRLVVLYGSAAGGNHRCAAAAAAAPVGRERRMG